MSIISSTNTGRRGVKITEDLLLKRGYSYKGFFKNLFDCNRMYYNDKNFVMVEKYSDGSDCRVYVSIANNVNSCNFTINNFEDLLLVESYWNATTQKRKQKYKNKLLTKLIKQ